MSIFQFSSNYLEEDERLCGVHKRIFKKKNYLKANSQSELNIINFLTNKVKTLVKS